LDNVEKSLLLERGYIILKLLCPKAGTATSFPNPVQYHLYF
jgi:hypothetical protein